ncbi:MAG TPA: tetratricopeptide repeat protein, partial [Candidatus Acidoferrales bacterium]|nr:tetratricopeptide repeat protein [Candidatus Acidoferrales bacterium]
MRHPSLSLRAYLSVFTTALFLVELAALSASADTIVLRNGRRITAANVVEEKDRVSYETPAGRLSLPRSIVERVVRGSGPVTEPAAQLPITAPPAETTEGYDEVVRATIHNDSIDRAYIARLEGAARSGGAEAAARAAAAHRAAALLELRLGDPEQAVGHYRRALTFAPEQLNLLLNIAYLHLRRSEYTAALDYLDRARRVAPGSADVAKLAG